MQKLIEQLSAAREACAQVRHDLMLCSKEQLVTFCIEVLWLSASQPLGDQVDESKREKLNGNGHAQPAKAPPREKLTIWQAVELALTEAPGQTTSELHSAVTALGVKTTLDSLRSAMQGRREKLVLDGRKWSLKGARKGARAS